MDFYEVQHDINKIHSINSTLVDRREVCTSFMIKDWHSYQLFIDTFIEL
jgi:hypothetical protein